MQTGFHQSLSLQPKTPKTHCHWCLGRIPYNHPIHFLTVTVPSLPLPAPVRRMSFSSAPGRVQLCQLLLRSRSWAVQAQDFGRGSRFTYWFLVGNKGIESLCDMFPYQHQCPLLFQLHVLFPYIAGTPIYAPRQYNAGYKGPRRGTPNFENPPSF